MKIRSYRELFAWQKSMDLVEMVYRGTEGFPQREMFGLTNQMRRAAVSIPCNIAEGQGRNTTKEFLHFLSLGRGSLQELETQVLIAGRLNFHAEKNQHDLLCATGEVARIINGLVNSLSK